MSMDIPIAVRVVWFILLVCGGTLLSAGLYYIIENDDLVQRKRYALLQLSGVLLWLILICLLLFWPYR